MTGDSWEHRMAARARARAAERRVEEIAARGDPFAPWRRPDDPIDILPAIIAARCLGISYGDPGPKLPADRCRECWGERFVWFGNCWGLQHVGQRVGEYRRCDHSCHDDEVLLADGSAVGGKPEGRP